MKTILKSKKYNENKWKITHTPKNIIKQILKNQEKAELYNPVFKEFYDNWHHILQENKQLKEKLEKITNLIKDSIKLGGSEVDRYYDLIKSLEEILITLHLKCSGGESWKYKIQ